MIRTRNLLVAMLAAAVAACGTDAPQALGTLEYDRITLPSPAAERIVEINVREGQRVAVGQSLLKLEATRTESATRADRSNGATRGARNRANASRSSMTAFSESMRETM